MKINLHIERLVLEGLPVTAHQGRLIQAAMESELARQLGADGLREINSAALGHLPGGQIKLANHNPPAQTGKQIAQAVYSGLASLRAAPRAIPDGGRRDA